MHTHLEVVLYILLRVTASENVGHDSQCWHHPKTVDNFVYDNGTSCRIRINCHFNMINIISLFKISIYSVISVWHKYYTIEVARDKCWKICYPEHLNIVFFSYGSLRNAISLLYLIIISSFLQLTQNSLNHFLLGKVISSHHWSITFLVHII